MNDYETYERANKAARKAEARDGLRRMIVQQDGKYYVTRYMMDGGVYRIADNVCVARIS